MNIFKKSFTDAVSTIQQNKKLFLLLLLIQVVSIVIISFVFVKFQLVLFEDLEQLTAGIQQIDVNEQSDYNDILKGFADLKWVSDRMLSNIFNFFLWMLIVFLIGSGLVWSITNILIHKGKLLPYFFRFCVLSIIFILPSSFILYLALQKTLLDPNVFSLVMNIFMYLSFIIAYFIMISFTLLPVRLKNYPMALFKTAIRRYYYFIPLMFVSLALPMGLIYIAYQYAFSFLSLAASAITFVFALVITKIYLITFTKQLIK